MKKLASMVLTFAAAAFLTAGLVGCTSSTTTPKKDNAPKTDAAKTDAAKTDAAKTDANK